MEQDFANRLIIVIHKNIEGWQIPNTAAHVGAFIGNKLRDRFGTGDFFYTKDKVTYPRNSQYTMVIKRANSSEQLKNLMEKVRDSNLLYLGFIREMIDQSDDTEIQKILDTKDDADIELLGIGIFGPTDEVNSLTKKFGLWN